MSHDIIVDNGAIARAELDMQITTAKAYPRKTSDCIKMAEDLATMDEDTAESCIYYLPRKDKEGKRVDIKGPSIRLAEIMASSWGNLHAATRIVENDGKFITAEGVAWDLEKNLRISSQVKRNITTSKGQTFSADMQAVTGNAASSIALRNSIFRVIPRSIIDKIYDSAVKKAVGDQKTLASRLKKTFEKFEKLGIEEQKIFAFFGKSKMEEFTADDLTALIGIGTSIRDGLTQIDKAFVIEEAATDKNASDRVNDLVGGEQ